MARPHVPIKRQPKSSCAATAEEMLDWIFPRLCELCHAPSEDALCPACAAGLPRVPVPICLYCGAPVISGRQEQPDRCRECAARSADFDFARSALISSESAFKLIYRLKYHRANYLALALARILNELWQSTPALMAHQDWALVPVPVGAGHLYMRGFNQAEELAKMLGRLRGLRVISPLQRLSTGAESQTRLSAAERRRNAFLSYAPLPSWAQGRKRLPEQLVLVDDVYTTGSTARACARALKSLPGVKRVAALSVLRVSVRDDF